jgi:hypothetical protein
LQLLKSLVKSRQEPEQLVSPAWHETTHALAEQTWPATHTIPQPLQLLKSLVVSRQVPEQLVSPVWQASAQLLPEHT